MYGVTLIESTCALILLSAAAAKARDLTGFARALQGYRIVPAGATVAASTLLVVTEAVLGVGLLAVPGNAAVTLGAAALFVGFAAAGARSLAQGDRNLDCGCLGTGVRLRLGWVAVSVNLLASLTLLAAFALADGVRPHADERVVLGMVGLLLAATYWLVLYGASVLRLVQDAITVTPASQREGRDVRA